METMDRQSRLITRLKTLLQAATPIHAKIQKRCALIHRMQQFEQSARDPNRLFGPSFRLMEEDRFRKTALPTLLRLEADLETALRDFQERFDGQPVYWEGGKDYGKVMAEEKASRYINEALFEFVPKDTTEVPQTTITMSTEDETKTRPQSSINIRPKRKIT